VVIAAEIREGYDVGVVGPCCTEDKAMLANALEVMYQKRSTLSGVIVNRMIVVK